MKRVLDSFVFSLVVFMLNFFVNSIAYLFIKYNSFFGLNEYPFFEIQLGVLIYFISFVFLFTCIVKLNWFWIFMPLLYLAFSIFMTYPRTIEGWDLMHTLNFGISQFIYLFYEYIRLTGFLNKDLIDLILFNGLIFAYLLVLFYISKLFFYNKVRLFLYNFTFK